MHMTTKIFCCYARKDELLLNQLKAHLRPLQRQGLIEVWDDQCIEAGAAWEAEITKHLDEAPIILLLVSPDFLNSDYCYGVEMQRAIQRHAYGEATVIPVILRPCLWQGTPFGKIQALPKNALPVRSWDDVDDAFLDVASGVQRVVEQLPTNTYPLKKWRRSDPFCYIFLLDQSYRTSYSFGQGLTGKSIRICDSLATGFNAFLNELIITYGTVLDSYRAFEISSCIDIGIIGYRGNALHFPLTHLLQEKDLVPLSELHRNPLKIVMRKRKEIDETGMEIEFEVPFPIWVEPRTRGNAPMCAALGAARDLVGRWVSDHPDSYPPIIMNISPGSVDDGDPTKQLRQIRQVSTKLGQTLIYNICIADSNSAPIYFPASEHELPSEASSARQLFSMSSVIPTLYRRQLNAFSGLERHIPIGSRGFIYNGDITALRYVLPRLDSQPWFDRDKD